MRCNAATRDVERASGQQGFGRLFWLVVLVIGVSFFCLEGTWHFVLQESADSASDAEASIDVYVGGADLLRRFGFFVIGGLGVLLLARRGPGLRAGGLLPWLLLAATAWCAVSAFWSDAPMQTARRLLGMAMAMVGALGLAKHCTTRQLCLMAGVVAAAIGVAALASDVSLGAFHPFSGDYRLAGIGHPNTVGLYMGLLCLAAACFVADGAWGRLLPGTAFSLGLAALLLSKSRTALVAMAISVAAVAWIRMNGRARIVAALVAAWVLSTALLLLQFVDSSSRSELSQAALLGREEGASDLTGRVPLWRELSRFVMERPWTGYGYQGFWTRERYELLAEDQQWVMPHSHNVYIEAALGLGLVGAALLLLVTLAAAWRLAGRLHREWEVGTVFLLGLLVLGWVHGLSESSLGTPTFITFIGVVGILRIALFDEEPGLPSADPGFLGQPVGSRWSPGSLGRAGS